MSERVDDIQVPLKLRFKAWWEGYDLNDVKERIRMLREGEAAGSAAPSAKNSFTTRRQTASDQIPLTQEDQQNTLSWDKLRMEMSQLIWGDGYCGPGGRDHIETMSKLLTMNSEMSALVVGAGLGGPSRVLAEEFGVWITGYEISPELAERGMQMSIDAGLSAKAVIQHLDPEKKNPFDRRYDRAFSKEALYSFPDKQKILQDVFNTLKNDALFLITDYTLSDKSALENHDVQKWLKQEASPPYPVPTKQMQSELEKAGFALRVNEDISDHYIKLIESSWSKAQIISQQLATKGPEGTEAVKTLMVEAEHWALRAKLLKEGLIHVWRFLAYKPKKQIR